MSGDSTYAIFWLAVLFLGITATVLARAAGLASTHARDLLHIGAGVWVLGWPGWHHPAAPMTIALAAALATALVPVLAGRVALAARFRDSVASGDERFLGLILYTASFAAITVAAFVLPEASAAMFAGGCALFALSLGDGIGGALGQAFGRVHYRAPGGKEKSLEGSLAVWAASSAGAWFAARLFAVAVPALGVIALGAVAAAAEAAAPRGTDNLVVPAAVWSAAWFFT